MKNKKIYSVFLIIIILVSIIMIFYSSTQQTTFSSNSNKLNINMDISKTSITKIAENDKTITYRLTWKTKSSSEFTCATNKDINIKFNVADFESINNKILLPNNVLNQFGIETTKVYFENIKAYKNPCTNTPVEVKAKIINKKAICSLVRENNKPIISCIVEADISYSIPVNFYGSVDGNLDITFIKEEVSK